MSHGAAPSLGRMGILPHPERGVRDVLIKDLSETGRRFFDKFSGLVQAKISVLELRSLDRSLRTFGGTRRDYVCAEFERPLYGTVFDHIRLRLAWSGQLIRTFLQRHDSAIWRHAPSRSHRA